MINEAREGQERGYGIPLTDEERAARHYELYESTDIPPRGSGLASIGQTGVSIQAPWLAVAIGGVVGALVMPKRRILGAAVGAGIGWLLSWALRRNQVAAIDSN